MGRYKDFWTITEEALEFAIQRCGLQVTAEQRQRLKDAWLHPTPYPEVAAALPRLKEKYVLAILSNGSPEMLRSGLEQTGLMPNFRRVLSADAVKLYKPSAKVYELAPKHLRLNKSDILFVSSNSFDVIGAKSFGFKVCWIDRSGVPLDPLGPKPDLVAQNFDDLVEALSNQQADGES
jgi:2-haloacid dehalogenase